MKYKISHSLVHAINNGITENLGLSFMDTVLMQRRLDNSKHFMAFVPRTYCMSEYLIITITP